MANSERTNRQAKQGSGMSIVLILAALLIFLASLMVFQACDQSAVSGPGMQNNGQSGIQVPDSLKPNGTPDATGNSGNAGNTETQGTTGPTEPYVMSTASVGVTGDVLMHGPVMLVRKLKTAKAFWLHPGARMRHIINQQQLKCC